MRAPAGKREKPEQGFTMVEVLIAIVLAAIALIGILALYMSETKASAFSRHSTEAAVLAEDYLEKLRTQGSALAGSATVTTLDEKGVVGSGIYTRFYWEQLVGTSYATIEVKVTWSDEGVAHTVQVQGARNQ